MSKLEKMVFSVPFWPFLAHFLVQMGQNGPKLFFSEFWGQTISNEGSHAYVWTKPEKMVFLVLFDPFRPKNGAKNQFWAKQKILPLEIPTMMPETPIKMGELTLGTLTAGMTTARTDGRTDGRCYDDNTLLRGVKMTKSGTWVPTVRQVKVRYLRFRFYPFMCEINHFV